MESDEFVLPSTQEVCETRKKYRAGKRETAVKVYTINQESRYLIVQNVPSLGATEDLLKLFSLYGRIDQWRYLDECKMKEEFTEAYWIKFEFIANAHEAKRALDDYPFLGKLLHVAYAPQFETVLDTEEKLLQRRQQVLDTIKEISSQRITSKTIRNTNIAKRQRKN